jgi:hypothetical protein
LKCRGDDRRHVFPSQTKPKQLPFFRTGRFYDSNNNNNNNKNNVLKYKLNLHTVFRTHFAHKRDRDGGTMTVTVFTVRIVVVSRAHTHAYTYV